MISEHRVADQAGGTYGSSEAAAGWQRSSVARAQILAPLTERMLDLAGVDIGHRVLDVAAGTGEQTLLAAQRVGPTGAVLATDIAARMLALAEEAAARTGLGNVETRVLDARDLNLEPESFDAAIARLALMLVPERTRVMAGIRRALKPGKKFAALKARRCIGPIANIADKKRWLDCFRQGGFPRLVPNPTARVDAGQCDL
jgi:ubiquinone/menaquinone biosynthesis C-methylase UbiE